MLGGRQNAIDCAASTTLETEQEESFSRQSLEQYNELSAIASGSHEALLARGMRAPQTVHQFRSRSIVYLVKGEGDESDGEKTKGRCGLYKYVCVWVSQTRRLSF